MKLYALIISNEDYVDTTLFDDLKRRATPSITYQE